MKNPETEAISGFCCKLHYQSAEKGGLLSMIPGGEPCRTNYSLIRFAHRVILFSSVLAQTSLTRPSENKNPPTSSRE